MLPDLAVATIPVAALVPYAENARTHSEDQVAQIGASIAEFGFVNPVLVDAAGVLVAGHGRVIAAKRLGMTAVPAIRLAHLTEAQARALRLADNQIALNSGWDEALLAAEIARIRDRLQDLCADQFAIALLQAVDRDRQSAFRDAEFAGQRLVGPPLRAGAEQRSHPRKLFRLAHRALLRPEPVERLLEQREHPIALEMLARRQRCRARRQLQPVLRRVLVEIHHAGGIAQAAASWPGM